jgi:hypothetical protein
MSCGFDKSLIAALYDGETTDAERAEAERHLASCPECARDLASMKDLSAALKPLSGASAPLSIAEGVIRQIGAVRPRRRPWIAWSLSAAAALILTVGTAYLLDRQTPQQGGEPVAAAPKPSSRLQEPKVREELRRSSNPAPAAEAARSFVDPKNEEVHVVRVTSGDVAGARAVVDAFLKERKLTVKPDAAPLGRTALARQRYLQLDLTEGEINELEKRLAELKGTTIARGTLEAERKMRSARSGDDEFKVAPEADKGETDRAEGVAGLVARRKVIFIFVPADPKK